MVTGSILNKLVSEAVDERGNPWDKISEAMQVYELADVKHGRIIWDVLAGCLLRDIFPDPEAALFLTGVTQREFVAEFNILLVEALAGAEIQTGPLSSARSREDVEKCIRFRTETGAISIGPPSQWRY